MFVRTALAVTLAVFTAAPVWAAEKKTTPLRDILNEISKTSPEIRESVNVFDSVNAELKMAKTGYNPTVSAYLSGGKEITDGVDTDGERKDLNSTSASLTLRQNVFNGNGTANYVRETQARAMSASYDVLNVANKIFLAASESYITVLQEKELLDIALENVTTQAQILEQIKEKTKSGFGKLSDLTNAQARLALSRANYISQQQNLKQAIVKFHRQAGRFVTPEEFVMPELTYSLPKSADDMVDIAFTTYPAINVADYNIVAKKYGKKRVNAQYYPSVDFELKATHNNNTGGDEGSTDIQSAMLSLNYNLYDGGKRNAEKQLRSAEMMKEYERSYVERRNLIEAVRLAWNIKEAEDAKIPFLKDYVELTGKTRDAFVEENRLGRRSLNEVLNMENEYNSSKATLARSKYNSIIAYFRLLQATGLLLAEYDDALAGKVGLPEKKPMNKLEKYGNLDFNKDKDEADDKKDQCQQSASAQTAPFGCENTEGVEVGYTIPDYFAPYIKPQVSIPASAPQDSLESISSDSLGEPEKSSDAAARTAAKPVAVKPAAKTAVPAVLPPAKMIDLNKKEQTITLPGNSFKPNTFDLTDEATATLLRIARELRTLKTPYTLKIYAHTDDSLTPEQGKDMTKLMVFAVHNRFLELGIPKGAMLGYGKGGSEPLVPNDSETARARNKRVELKIIKN